jgi:peroxiredoxin
METIAAPPFDATLESAVTQHGESLASLSRSAPTLVVFLRHLGCAFCREALSDVARARPELEADGTTIVLVHQSPDDEAASFFAGYGLDDVPRIADPDLALYRAFGLRRGGAGELLSPTVVARAAAALVRGHGPGRPRGDTRQLPGVFLLRDGEIVASFRHETAADRPDYAGIARCDSGSCELAR